MGVGIGQDLGIGAKVDETPENETELAISAARVDFPVGKRTGAAFTEDQVVLGVQGRFSLPEAIDGGDALVNRTTAFEKQHRDTAFSQDQCREQARGSGANDHDASFTGKNVPFRRWCRQSVSSLIFFGK